MVHQDEYDTLCRVLTDYEGYGTEDDDVVGDIDVGLEVERDVSDSDSNG